jgi:uncharacterized protein YlaI
MQVKQCYVCKEEKELDEFGFEKKHWRKHKVMYRKTTCNECLRERNRIWRENNKQKYNKYLNDYRKLSF